MPQFLPEYSSEKITKIRRKNKSGTFFMAHGV